MNKGGEVLIYHMLSLLPVLDTERCAQDCNIVEIFFRPASHQLAGQDIPQVVGYVEVQLLIRFEQAHRRKLILAELKQKG